MIRQSMKWFGNIAVSSAFVCLAALSAPAQTVSQPTTTGYFGQNLVESGLTTQIERKYGSGSNLNTNVIIPMTTGAPMSTLNSAQTFTSQLFCPASQKFLTLTVLPSGSGDLQALVVDEDMDMNGSVDYSFSLPANIRVSGVCGNGFISCDAGTWSNCAYYKWIADSTGRVGTQLTISDRLGGCYCINNNCGSNIVMNDMTIILQSLGGGAVGAVQASNAHLAVTKASVEPFIINYYAQSTQDCSIGAAAASTNDQTKYFQGTGDINADSATEAGAQAADNTSIYSTLLTSQAMISSHAAYNTCRVSKSLNINTTGVDPSYAYLPWLDISGHIYMGRDSNNFITYTILVDTDSDGVYDRTDTYSDGAGLIACGDMSIWETWLQGRLDAYVSQYQTTYSVPVADIQPGTPSPTVGISDGGGRRCTENEHWINNYRIDKKSPPICPSDYTYLAADNKCYIENDSIAVVDSCSSYQSDSTCTKKDEIVDGVFVFKNYNTTGLAPITTCKTMPGKLGNYTECQQWWEKHITYRCASTGYDFSNSSRRVGNIEQTTTLDSTGLHYQDALMDGSGNWAYSDTTIPHSQVMDGTTTACEFACKTKKPWTDTATSGSTTRSSTNVTTEEYMIFIKRCTESGCDVDTAAGEILVQDCQCMSGFLEGAAALDIIGEAGNDMICSSGLTQ